jgi:hypothetical protein
MNTNPIDSYLDMSAVKRAAVVLSLAVMVACSGNQHTLRIKTDKDFRGAARTETDPRLDVPPPKAGELMPQKNLNVLDTAAIYGPQANQLINLLVNAQINLSEGNYQTAEEHVQKALSIHKSRELVLLLIEIYERRGEAEKADDFRLILKE